MNAATSAIGAAMLSAEDDYYTPDFDFFYKRPNWALRALGWSITVAVPVVAVLYWKGML